MIDPSPRIPKYRYLYETLRRQITQGEFRAGDLLPSEKDLRLQYELTKPTIRQALDLLLQDGYIRKHQGKGSIVKPLPLGLGVMSIVGRIVDTAAVDATSLDASESEKQPEPRISTQILVPPMLADFPADVLFLPAEADLADRFYYLERLRLVDDEPVFFEKLIIPSRHLPDFPEQVLENRSWFDLLRTKYELIVQGGEQKLLATAATDELAHRLNVIPGSPVLRLDKRVDTNRIDVSYYSSLYARTDHFLLHGRF